MQQNEIRIEQRDSVTVLEIQGDITVFSEPFLNEAYTCASNQGAVKILLQFDGNAYINSGGIALLIQLLAKARTRDQEVAITGLSAHFKKIFHMVGITKFAKIYDTLQEALQKMS
ncbi:MAG: STAS domain-containing protein [Deltaproteobacteria bacterium]|nr:STAS domain-containing protein [Deltaproteobacteria bacterium]